MARTNAQIIFDKQMELMEAGVIGTTGRQMTFEDIDGKKHTISEPEEIHTYAAWKSMGYQVKKGEKAIAKFTIWKQTVKKAKTEDEQDETKMFLANAAFFKSTQVEAIAKKSA